MEKSDSKIDKRELLKKLEIVEVMRIATLTHDPEILSVLSEHENDIIRGCVAANPNTDEDTLNVLAHDSSIHVGMKLKSNPNAPKNIETTMPGQAASAENIIQLENYRIRKAVEE